MQDRVEIKVLEGRNITSASGHPCRVFIEAHCGDEMAITKTAQFSINPKWESNALVFSNLVRNDVQTAVLIAKHKDQTSQNEEVVGMVILELDSAIHSPAIPLEFWLPLSRAPTMTSAPSGDLFVSLTYFLNSELAIVENEEDLIASNDQKPPNLLKVNVLKARGLAEVSKSQCDLVVVVMDKENAYESKPVPKTITPSWDHEILVPHSDGRVPVEVHVKESHLLRKVPIGACKISLVEVASCGSEGLSKWFSLYTDVDRFDRESFRGEIQLHLVWCYEEGVTEKKSSLLSRFRLPSAGKGLKSDELDEFLKKEQEIAMMKQNKAFHVDDDDVEMNEEEILSEEEARTRRKQDAERFAVENEDKQEAIVPVGDYCVQVHIIECRDLKGEDAGGTSDPIVIVSCLGEKRKTSEMKQVTSCVFDETLFFNFSNLTREQIEDASIKIAVFDVDLFSSNDLIGIFQFDFLSVYSQPDHEIYRSWVGIVDNEENDDKGIQGYVKLSITILGQGNKQKYHDLDKEILEELASEQQSGGLGGIVLNAPVVKQELNFLILSIYGAQNLLLAGKQSNVAYFSAEFGGNPSIDTSAFSQLGPGDDSLIHIDEELWIPIWVPSMCSRVALSLLTKQLMSKPAVQSAIYLDFKSIQRLKASDFKERQGRPQWYNLYGASNAVSGKNAQLMNKYPDIANHYKGRVLMSAVVIVEPDGEEPENVTMKPASKPLIDYMIPKLARYTMRMYLYQASEVPLPLIKQASGFSRYKVVVSWGCKEMSYSAKSANQGRIEWNEVKEIDEISMPDSLSQLPDVFVYLLRGNESNVNTIISCCRMKAIELIAEPFDAQPRWIPLESDHSNDKFGGLLSSSDYFPGTLLMRMGLANVNDVTSTSWDEEKTALSIKKPYSIRVHVYQCKDLPAASDTALTNPYVKARFNGIKKKTSPKQMTTCPLFYETLEFQDMIPSDLRLGPEILVEVWNQNSLGSNIPIGVLRHPLYLCTISNSARDPVPIPVWRKLCDLTGREDEGEILCSFQLITKTSPGQVLPEASDITPASRPAYIDIINLGARDLESTSFQGISNPFSWFRVGFGNGAKTETSKVSRHPSPYNPNFLERHIIDTMLPDNPLYCPSIDLRICDKRIGGINNFVLGSTGVPLASKLPWSSDFIPPMQEMYQGGRKRPKKSKEEKKKKNDDELEEKNPIESASSNLYDDDNEDAKTSGSDDDAGSVTNVNDLGAGAFKFSETTIELPEIIDIEGKRQEEIARLKKLEKQKKEGKADWWNVSMSVPIPDIDSLVESEKFNIHDLDIEFPKTWINADYMTGRDWWINQSGEELERFMSTSPFESYPVYRGRKKGNATWIGRLKSSFKKVGFFKGIIRVTLADPRLDDIGIDLANLRRPQKLIARLYVIRGAHLQPKDWNGLSDPYLKIKFGTRTITDKEHMQKATLNPDFFSTFELPTEIPGAPIVQIQVFDHDTFGKDEIIGQTSIDLEDRWFHSKWQDIGLNHARSKEFGPLKPIEIRNLVVPQNGTSQGQLCMWVDILTPAQASLFRAEDLSPPPVCQFEIRVVVWKSEDIPAMDEMEGMSDIFCRLWMEGDKKKQETDVHWRCRNGSASWNYRIKLKVDLPLKSPEMARLKFQAWDKDIITANDVIGESSIDLYQWFMLAYHRKGTVKPFKEIKDALERRKMKKNATTKQPEVKAFSSDIETGDDQLDDSDDADGDRADPRQGLLTGGSSKKYSDKDLTDEEKKAEADKRKEKANADDAKEAVKQFKSLIGIGDIPDDAEWIKLTYHDREKGSVEDRGKVAISIHILPMDEADGKPVGNGRDEPNADPYLPPPVGRMQFSMNPFTMLSELCGPALLVKIGLCCLCLCCCVSIAFLGIYMQSFITMFQLFS